VRETAASFRMAFLPVLAVVTAWSIGLGTALVGVILWLLWPGPLPALIALVLGIEAAEAATLGFVFAGVAYFRVHVPEGQGSVRGPGAAAHGAGPPAGAGTAPRGLTAAVRRPASRPPRN
jgi:hypothetical protein